MSRFLHRLARVAVVVRRVVGAPDYEGYLAHVRAHHPDEEPLARDEFYLARLEERYSKPGARCC